MWSIPTTASMSYRNYGGSSTERGNGQQADSPGRASTIAANRPHSAGRRSVRTSASWTCADSPRTTFTTTRLGGVRNPRCIFFRIATGTARKFKCETAEEDAVNELRKDRAEFDAELDAIRHKESARE